MYNDFGIRERISMNIFVNPDIAYLLLMSGTILLTLALLMPGTHIIEGLTLIVLAGAGYEVYKLGIQWWAALILVIGLVPIVYAARKPGRIWFLVAGILCVVAGSLYAFPGEGLKPAVNPVLALPVSLFTAGFLWVSVSKVAQASRAHPLQDLGRLIGEIGEAKTEIHRTGTVQVASELWSARSEETIPAGSRVRVVRREGFYLIVEREG
jgi:membrane-bound serine protease (ClpP class)